MFGDQAADGWAARMSGIDGPGVAAHVRENAFNDRWRLDAYDEPAARIYGELMGDRKEHGLPMRVPDGQIAAIARLNHLAVATRNVVDFENCSVDIVNPFASAL